MRSLANLGIIADQEINVLFTPTACCAENVFSDGEENLLTFLISIIYLYTQHVMKNSVCKGGHPVEQREEEHPSGHTHADLHRYYLIA